MQVRDQLALTKSAIILYPCGTEVRFGDLEARANQLAHHHAAAMAAARTAIGTVRRGDG